MQQDERVTDKLCDDFCKADSFSMMVAYSNRSATNRVYQKSQRRCDESTK